MAMNPLQKLGAAAAILASSFAAAVPAAAQDTAPPTPAAMTAPEVQQGVTAEEAQHASAGRFVIHYGSDYGKFKLRALVELLHEETGIEVLALKNSGQSTFMYINDKIGFDITDVDVDIIIANSSKLQEQSGLQSLRANNGLKINDPA